MFLPIQVRDPLLPRPAVPVVAGPDPRIEIAPPDGTWVRVGADVDAATLRRVLAPLRR